MSKVRFLNEATQKRVAKMTRIKKMKIWMKQLKNKGYRQMLNLIANSVAQTTQSVILIVVGR